MPDDYLGGNPRTNRERMLAGDQYVADDPESGRRSLGEGVCPGVTIGDTSVVGAGAVVTRDIRADVVAVGNPARVTRSIGPSA